MITLAALVLALLVVAVAVWLVRRDERDAERERKLRAAQELIAANNGRPSPAPIDVEPVGHDGR